MQGRLDRYQPVMDVLAAYSPNGIGAIWGMAKLLAQTSINKKRAFGVFMKAMETIFDKLELCQRYSAIYRKLQKPEPLNKERAVGDYNAPLRTMTYRTPGKGEPLMPSRNFEMLLPMLYASVLVYAIKAMTFLTKGWLALRISVLRCIYP
ncbi:hypothetical protein BJ508DRAFT_14194 [Ascobolus immersus RN42]|uniref:DUF7708 domain-containing protein n=1 Tax=Ascobolus immersus RN42 TaxID=1160509 RepID=A0A3N4IHU9_ASCIM|nr:hypothetical protein BJ508DRAFT_14194 [Ascobolus immersus RN42]